MFVLTRSIVPALALTLACLGSLAHAEGEATVAPAQPMVDPRVRQFNFENGMDGWRATGVDGPEAPVAVNAKDHSGNAAQLVLADATAATLRRVGTIDLSRFQSLRFEVQAPRVNAEMHVAVYFVDADDFWYQTWRPIVARQETWQTVEVDLRPENGVFEPLGHSRPWGPYVARGVKEIGIRLFTDNPVRGNAYVDNITFVPYVNDEVPQAVYNFETSGKDVGRYKKFEVTFELTRTYDNPFDPTLVEVTAKFTAPSGTTITVPGFFYQDYERRIDRKVERLIPVGSPKWKVRFAPHEIGDYTWQVLIRDKGTFQTPPRSFTCVASSDPGFVRVSPQDVRYFEFENGAFFYPIGHNIPATFNMKAASHLGVSVEKFEGTAAYDRFLDGMKSANENYARVWLASWSFGLEWSRKYHPAYSGLGRYNQQNAWRLDYVLDKAEADNIYVQLALTTFGHFRLSGEFEGDWDFSPYNRANGGPLSSPQRFWTHGPSQEMYQRMVRYVMARWGYASHIAAWEVSNEIDLVTGFKENHSDIVAWHRRCAETVSRFDPNQHLITTNFANAGHDPEILALPEISFSSTNNYTIQIVEALRKTIFPNKSAFRKPAIMAESGDDFHGSTPELTNDYIHIILWGSYMIPFAGAAMPWWWDYIDDQNLYPMFKPMVEFAKGEERRNQKLETTDGALVNDAGNSVAGLAALALQNDKKAYVWVYERGIMRGASAPVFLPNPREGVILQLSGFAPGSYTVEFWDTWKGGILKQLTAEAKDGTLRCPFPMFTTDIAVKVKSAGN